MTDVVTFKRFWETFHGKSLAGTLGTLNSQLSKVENYACKQSESKLKLMKEKIKRSAENHDWMENGVIFMGGYSTPRT